MAQRTFWLLDRVFNGVILVFIIIVIFAMLTGPLGHRRSRAGRGDTNIIDQLSLHTNAQPIR